MTDAELRLECVKIAKEILPQNSDIEDIIKESERLFNYLVSKQELKG